MKIEIPGGNFFDRFKKPAVYTLPPYAAAAYQAAMAVQQERAARFAVEDGQIAEVVEASHLNDVYTSFCLHVRPAGVDLRFAGGSPKLWDGSYEGGKYRDIREVNHFGPQNTRDGQHRLIDREVRLTDGEIVKYHHFEDRFHWDGVRETKYLHIRVYPNGVIEIEGNRQRGFVKLPRKAWSGDSHAIENALGSAYDHPEVRREEVGCNGRE